MQEHLDYVFFHFSTEFHSSIFGYNLSSSLSSSLYHTLDKGLTYWIHVLSLLDSNTLACLWRPTGSLFGVTVHRFYETSSQTRFFKHSTKIEPNQFLCQKPEEAVGNSSRGLILPTCREFLLCRELYTSHRFAPPS